MNADLTALFAQLLQVFGPIVLQLIAQWQSDHNSTKIPTMAELQADYQDTIDAYLAEGGAWRTAHPEA